jgi:hypothetical protein
LQNEKITSKMLGIIRNFIRKFSNNLSAYSLGKTPETNSRISRTVRQETDHLNAPSIIKNNQINRFGFMEGEGRVPDDFNTIGSSEIESMFYDNK